MFGYIMANSKKLTEEEQNVVRYYYCGLCEAIKNRHGHVHRMTLSYDMTFLAILLSSLTDEPLKQKKGICPSHPFKPHTFYSGRYIDYAADMNILLSYYNLMDDWHDDNNMISAGGALLIKDSLKIIDYWYPEKHSAVKKTLRQLGELEADNELNPDLAANCFAPLLGEVFAFPGSEQYERLYDFGAALGKFIYIMDASLDLKEDVQKQRYNPLISFPSEQFPMILNMLMSDCMNRYRKLDVCCNQGLIENILYSGIWTKYYAINKKEHNQE